VPPYRVAQSQGLSRDELEAIAALERRVVTHDGGRLKLEWGVLRSRPGGEVNDLLVWGPEGLVGFLGVYTFGAEPELAGAVDPAHRRRGVGSALLDGALQLVARRGDQTVLLVTPRTHGAGASFALGKGAALHHAEHHMELTGSPPGPPPPRASTDGLVLRAASGADRPAVERILEDAFGQGAAWAVAADPGDAAFVAETGGRVVGTLRLAFDDGVAGIYGLAVQRELRGRGIGRAMLHGACLEARRRGADRVTLEVEVDNDRALGLYTSAGFERVATEDYFRLTVPGAR